MRRAIGAVLAMAAIVVPVATTAQQTTIADQRRQLRAATQAAQMAARRSRALARQAEAARGEAAKAAADRAAVAARAQAAEADIAAARARIAIIDRMMAGQANRLADRQAPTTRLVAALQSLARRPAVLGLLQPGSTRDAVHVRAVLATVIPAVQARSSALRQDIARTRRLRASAGEAALALRDGRRRLDDERLALLRIEAASRLRSRDLGRSALVESDRALALGEEARDIVDRMVLMDSAEAVRVRLERLAGPLPRPGDSAGEAVGAPPYRLPVAGRVTMGLGEVSPTGVRSRGLTLATLPRAVVAAPAAGRIVYARPFRSYGNVVIVDHGEGWTSLLTGLASVSASAGQTVAAGETIGRAGGAPAAVTVELRRRGRPIDMVPLLD